LKIAPEKSGAIFLGYELVKKTEIENLRQLLFGSGKIEVCPKHS
jgi:hypothetical protein